MADAIATAGMDEAKAERTKADFHIQEYPGEEAEDRAVIDSYKAFDWAAAQRMLTASPK